MAPPPSRSQRFGPIADLSAVPLGAFPFDDHEVVRTGLRALLEAREDIDVAGVAGTMAGAPTRIPAAQPEVAIFHVSARSTGSRPAATTPEPDVLPGARSFRTRSFRTRSFRTWSFRTWSFRTRSSGTRS